ncbi:sigma-54 interaction domain-containing protein [Pseudomonas sp. NPDC096950]|uniref:sigma-54 interaction domain-containing protein n=1 Tax=Pseudomonas sp. NPDC096950 TaxID=3364485 RepID=UPI00383A30D5
MNVPDHTRAPLTGQALVSEVRFFPRPEEANPHSQAEHSLAGAHTSELVGNSPALSAACHLLHRVAPTRATVLFTGESGVGKEMFARMLHCASPRSNGPFVAVNCAAIPETLMESELFGVEKGAFTGATQSRPGRFERADGGTLFLDEIGTLSMVAQGKLLRALQESEVERVGGLRTLKIDVRLVAATNVDLREAVRCGEFREDLFFRLEVFPIHLPPLRERKEDIPLLINHFMQRFNAMHGKHLKGFTPSALEMLLDHDFPGNIRELQNFVERGVINGCDHQHIDLAHLLAQGSRSAETTTVESGKMPGDLSRAEMFQVTLRSLLDSAQQQDMTLQHLETLLIDQTMDSVKGNVSEAARRLGLTRAQLSYRISRRLVP